MAAEFDVPLRNLRAFATERKDRWWLMPLVTFVVFSSFVVYVTWALFQGVNYTYGNYLSPLYSPELLGDSPHSIFGPFPAWWPRHLLPASPAILILLFPLSFRMSCYYYRGAYYKAFWLDPPACAVGEPRKSYRGEAKLPLIIMNLHRYALYFALIFVVILSHDVWKALWFMNPATGKEQFGVGVGTLVLAINTILIAGYTFGCHSFRHLVGGVLDVITRSPVRHKIYRCVGTLNSRHQIWAWFSLVWVGFTDIYVRLLATGQIHDLRLF
jgi:hypothetical protein